MKVIEQNLKKFRSVLKYLNTYPEVISILKIGSLLKPENLDNHYQEWLHLIDLFEGMEKEHFKTCWLPIEEAAFNFFVDLNDANLPLFQCTYMFYEPYGYFNTVLFSSMQEFLMSVESGADFSKIAFNHFLNVCNDFKNIHHNNALPSSPHENPVI